MVCKIRYLSSAGLQSREVPGITELASAFPSEWLFYTSLQCYPKDERPIEIDAMVVMDDRVLLMELKDYHGDLSQNSLARTGLRGRGIHSGGYPPPVWRYSAKCRGNGMGESNAGGAASGLGRTRRAIGLQPCQEGRGECICHARGKIE